MKRLAEAPAPKKDDSRFNYGYYGYYSSYYDVHNSKTCAIGCVKCVAQDIHAQLNRNGLVLEARNDRGETLVEVAAIRGLWDLVGTLIGKGAQVREKRILVDESGTLRAEVVEIPCYTDIYRSLQSRGYDFGVCDPMGRNLLSQFILRLKDKNFSASVFQTFVRGGALPYVKGE